MATPAERVPAARDAARDVLNGVVSTRAIIQVPGQPAPAPPRGPTPPPIAVRPDGRPAPVRPPIRLGRGQRIAGLVVLLVLFLGGAWFGWRAWHGVPVSLEAGGTPISNAGQVLSQAEAVFQLTASTDGAQLPDGAGCWFAPAAEGAFSPDPRIACGPAILGISGDRDRWVVGDVSYSPTSFSSDSAGMKGTFSRFSGTAELKPSTLNRPDGADPPSGEPTLGGEPIRTDDGQVLTGIDTALARADPLFAGTAIESGAATGPESRCYLGLQQQSRFGVRLRVSDGQVWCGPVLVTDSKPGATWAAYSLFRSTGDVIVDAVAGDTYISSVSTTRAMPAGITPYRSDGRTPPAGSGGLTVPDAAAADPGTVQIVETLPEGTDASGFSAPSDGRLTTPNLSMKITALGRVPKIGQGPDALVAPPGYEVVVAEFDVTRAEDAPYGNGTATLITGATRTAIPNWGSVRDHGVLAAVVPAMTGDVALELVAQERAQTISLTTGERGPGSPPALYQRLAGIAPGTPVTTSVALPAGDPVTVRGTIASVRWSAWTRADGWAPDGSAFLTVTVDGWTLDRPCCDVSGLEVATAWKVLLPGGSSIAESSPAASAAGRPEPVFTVPGSIAQGAVQLQVGATFTVDGAQRRASARPIRLPFTVRSP